MTDRIVGDTWYAEKIGATPLRTALSGPLRGLALFLAGRRANAIVTTNSAPGTTTCVILCGLFGVRRLVLLEYIVHPVTSGPHWWYFRLVRRFLLGRALLVAQVLSADEARRYPGLHRMPAERFALVRWPARLTDDPLPPAHHDRLVVASGRRCDWPTFLAAARGADWQVRAVCTGADLPLVRSLAGPNVVVRHDIPADEHQAEVAAATVYVLAVPETGASIGQIRVMNAVQAGVPIVASAVTGLADYLDDDSAVLVPPGDPVALRAAIDTLLDDPDRRDKLRRTAHERGDAGDTMADYLARIRQLIRPHGL
ncbi:MAG TPA: glycosyltransferase [Pseudonocardiaceae bacterium]|nr:glycosyltransferase [Pseudonocardiaceae bacterium]